MQVKIDTKEKFHVITLAETKLPADMSDSLYDTLMPYLQNGVKNIILNVKDLQSIDLQSAETLVKVQQKFYEQGASFLVCGLQAPVEEFLDENGLLEMMNVTPTESEAWDIVQMEEIERELLGDDPL